MQDGADIGADRDETDMAYDEERARNLNESPKKGRPEPWNAQALDQRDHVEIVSETVH